MRRFSRAMTRALARVASLKAWSAMPAEPIVSTGLPLVRRTATLACWPILPRNERIG
jgi:hypothetical protein